MFLNSITSVHNNICRNKKTDCIFCTFFDLRNSGGMIVYGQKICPDGGTRDIVKIDPKLSACLCWKDLFISMSYYIRMAGLFCELRCNPIAGKSPQYNNNKVIQPSRMHSSFCHCICLWLPKGTFTSSPTA